MLAKSIMNKCLNDIFYILNPWTCERHSASLLGKGGGLLTPMLCVFEKCTSNLIYVDSVMHS